MRTATTQRTRRAISEAPSRAARSRATREKKRPMMDARNGDDCAAIALFALPRFASALGHPGDNTPARPNNLLLGRPRISQRDELPSDLRDGVESLLAEC